jgi:hypothetical protein
MRLGESGGIAPAQQLRAGMAGGAVSGDARQLGASGPATAGDPAGMMAAQLASALDPNPASPEASQSFAQWLGNLSSQVGQSMQIDVEKDPTYSIHQGGKQ